MLQAVIDELTRSSDERALLQLIAHPSLSEAQSAQLQSLLRNTLDWSSIIYLAQRNGLKLQLFRELENLGWEGVPEEVAEFLESQGRLILRHSFVLSCQLLYLTQVLDSHGIKAISFKGPSLGCLAYKDYTRRQFDDLDLLAERQDVPAIRRIFGELGFREVLPTVGKTLPADIFGSKVFRATVFELTFARECPEIGGQLLIDLHCQTSVSYLWPMDLAQLRQHVVATQLMDKPLDTLSPEALLVILAEHGLRSNWTRLCWVTDIAGLIASKPNLDWNAAYKIASDIRAETVLNLALYLAVTVLGIELPESIRVQVQACSAAERIAANLPKYWFDLDAISGARGLYQQWMAKKTLFEKTVLLVQWATLPNTTDWLAFPVPSPLYPIYYLYHPMRVIMLPVMRKGLKRIVADAVSTSAAGLE